MRYPLKFRTWFAILSTLLLSASLLIAQEADTGAVEEAADHGGGTNMIEMILHGGPLIIFIWICILLTSMVMVTFIIQLYLACRMEALAPKALFEAVRNSIHAGNYQEAWEVCSVNKSYLAQVLKTALERIGRGKDAVETALVEHGQRASQFLKTQNSYLSVIGVIAPMIGLLGTVIGMMGAFAVLGQSGVSNPRALAMSIGEVLTATASGLFIAIPAFVFYYYFRNKMTTVLVDADDRIFTLMEDIPYEELEGVHVGDEFEGGGGAVTDSGSRKVSMSLTTNCPVCNGSVQPGDNPCPHCGATLEWS